MRAYREQQCDGRVPFALLACVLVVLGTLSALGSSFAHGGTEAATWSVSATGQSYTSGFVPHSAVSPDHKGSACHGDAGHGVKGLPPGPVGSSPAPLSGGASLPLQCQGGTGVRGPSAPPVSLVDLHRLQVQRI
jgi:hypothetical protein